MKTRPVSIDMSPAEKAFNKVWARRARVTPVELVQTLLSGVLEQRRSEHTTEPQEIDTGLLTEYRRILNLKPRPQDVRIGIILKVWDFIYIQGRRLLNVSRIVWKFIRSRRT